MTSSITAEEYKTKLLHFIKERRDNKSSKLGLLLENNSSVTEDYHTNPKAINLKEIKSTGETAFQRAIFNEGHSMLDFQTEDNPPVRVNWFDACYYVKNAT